MPTAMFDFLVVCDAVLAMAQRIPLDGIANAVQNCLHGLTACLLSHGITRQLPLAVSHG